MRKKWRDLKILVLIMALLISSIGSQAVFAEEEAIPIVEEQNTFNYEEEQAEEEQPVEEEPVEEEPVEEEPVEEEPVEEEPVEEEPVEEEPVEEEPVEEQPVEEEPVEEEPVEEEPVEEQPVEEPVEEQPEESDAAPFSMAPRMLLASGSHLSVRHEKYVEKNPDGTYDLTLNVAGVVGSIINPAKLDLVFVLDRSGSMGSRIGGWGTITRRVAAGNAIDSMVASLVENQNLDVRFSLVYFSGDKNDDWGSAWNDATIAQGWTSQGSDITGKTYPDSNGGTNYQAGLREAKALLEDAREDAVTALVFVSDGNPTFRYNSSGYTIGEGNADSEGKNLEAAKTEANGVYADFFYTVGVGPSTEYDKLRDLKDAAENVPQEHRAFYEGTSTETLAAAFDSIEASMTTLLCDHVTISDSLSQNVELCTETIRIQVLDEQGETVAQGENILFWDDAEIRAAYDSESKQIQLIFPEEYQLKPGYLYQVTVVIRASDEAYRTYLENGAVYPDMGEAGTGNSSENQPGFYSNHAATVTYTYQGEQHLEDYPMPVIQLDTALLSIEKTVSGNMGDRNQAFDFQMQVYRNGVIWSGAIPYQKTEEDHGVLEDENGSYGMQLRDGETITFVLPLGCTYVVKEDPLDYWVNIDGEPVSEPTVTDCLNADTRLLFENRKELAPPTGLAEVGREVLPVMSLSVCGSLLFCYGLRKRRDRMMLWIRKTK